MSGRHQLLSTIQHVAEREPAGLDGSFLGGIVHMHNTKPFLVTLSPFKIIHQAPGKIAAHIHSLLQRLVQGLEVFLKITDSSNVIDLALLDAVIHRGTVLRYVEWR